MDFERWKDFDDDLFCKIKVECNSQTASSPVKICGSDISEEAFRIAMANVERAGLSDEVSLEVSDFKDH